jgi:hypothetical protein
MIAPYNPLVIGKVVEKTENYIKCQSDDNKRTFVFHYKETVTLENIFLIEMFGIDKRGLVTYHKK